MTNASSGKIKDLINAYLGVDDKNVLGGSGSGSGSNDPDNNNTVSIEIDVSDIKDANTKGPLYMEVYSAFIDKNGHWNKNTLLPISGNDNITENKLTLNNGGGYDKNSNSIDTFNFNKTVGTFYIRLTTGTTDGINIKRVRITYKDVPISFALIDNSTEDNKENRVGWLDNDDVNHPSSRWYFIEDMSGYIPVSIEIDVSGKDHANTVGPLFMILYSRNHKYKISMFGNGNIEGGGGHKLVLNNGWKYNKSTTYTDTFYIYQSLANEDLSIKLSNDTTDRIDISKLKIIGKNIDTTYTMVDNSYIWNNSANYIAKTENTVGLLELYEAPPSYDPLGIFVYPTFYPKIRWFNVDNIHGYKPVSIEISVSNVNDAQTDGPLNMMLYSKDKEKIKNIYCNGNIFNNALILNNGGGYKKNTAYTDKFYIDSTLDNFYIRLSSDTTNAINMSKVMITGHNIDTTYVIEKSGSYDNAVGWLEHHDKDHPRRWYMVRNVSNYNKVSFEIDVSNVDNTKTYGPLFLRLFSENKQTRNKLYCNGNIIENELILNNGLEYKENTKYTDTFYIHQDMNNFFIQIYTNATDVIFMSKVIIEFNGVSIPFDYVDNYSITNGFGIDNTVGWIGDDGKNPSHRWYSSIPTFSV